MIIIRDLKTAYVSRISKSDAGWSKIEIGSMSIFDNTCGPKNSRRYLILINVATAVIAIVFLIVGGVSLNYGEQFKKMLNTYCTDDCILEGCKTLACSETIPACDCSIPGTTVPTYVFTAPAAGLISVGVFSLLASFVGCYSSIRIKGAWLCAYIFAASFVLVLQFSFGVAAATLTNAEKLPGAFRMIFELEYKEFDWSYFVDFFPAACYAAKTAMPHQPDLPVHHPACFWNNTCDPLFSDCCGAGKICDTANKPSLCTSPQKCVVDFLSMVGTPVAVVALLTLVLEFLAIGLACVVRRETRAGGVFDPKSTQL